ncbi:MAG: valine--tRNA ligase [Anaerolineae bacterium]
MNLPRRYDPDEAEPRIQSFWEEAGVYHFARDEKAGPVYSIDTPPPTVSGHLHLGHVFSYSHPDFIARYRRMRGDNVFYPMGYDDNGLPTERLVEREEGVQALDVGREAFIQRCLDVSERAEAEYRELWQRLGLSIDWRYTYRTIDTWSRRISQQSFIDLYRKDLVYRQEAPTIWCPECATAIAQAELADLTRESVFYTLAFALEDGGTLQIATTRPELLPACVAVFVHPDDARFAGLVGRRAHVPYSGQTVPILADPAADPEKGTGAVMCCTFGDATDVAWWYAHDLPLRMALDRQGRMTELAGELAGLTVDEARAQIVESLAVQGLLLSRNPVEQSVRVHERCDTPVEYVVTKQWFVRVLDHRDELLAAGEEITWHPSHMVARYREWVDGLTWDWCISRQRYYGVTFPVWYCDECGEVILADEATLPMDPTQTAPTAPCACGSTRFTPEEDVMDTWATSSLSPQIVGGWLRDPELYAVVTPFSLRPQAHEIIRTWAFYTVVKSLYHFGAIPWHDAAISGWGLAPEGTGKISKSRGGGPMPPLQMIEAYSADAVRYWASSTGLGKDSVISEEKIQAGAKLVTKLWNVARFAARFLPPEGTLTAMDDATVAQLTPADRWILARLQTLIQRCTEHFEAYEYAIAKSEVEAFFWQELADNYLEMAKLRLYSDDADASSGARGAIAMTLAAVLKLFAPFIPHVTEELWQHLFADQPWQRSVHVESWPEPDGRFVDGTAETLGEVLVGIATAVRRYKSERALSLGSELAALVLVPEHEALAASLAVASVDLKSVSRAREVRVCQHLPENAVSILDNDAVRVGVVMAPDTD